MKTVDEELLHMAAAMRIPGMRHLRDLVVQAMDEAIARAQAETENGRRPRSGRPLKTTGRGSSWASMTPAERSAEMKRRLRVARAKRTRAEQDQADAKRHEISSRAAKKRWANMSKAKQKAHLAMMRAAKNKPSVKLVNGSAA